MFDYLIDGLGWMALLLIQYIILFKTYHKTKGDTPLWLYPFGVLFVLQDFLVNVIIMSVFMLELPREWLVTDRMQRYKKITSTDNWLRWWRYHFAENMCAILNVFDKGHC